MTDPHAHSSNSNGAVNRDQLQQLQYSHFHHPFPSTHHPYAQLQQQERHQHHQQQQQQQQHGYPQDGAGPVAFSNHLQQQGMAAAGAGVPPPQPLPGTGSQQQQQHQGLGFLPSDESHLPEGHHPPGPNGGDVHPGFPPPAQPSFFSPAAHQTPHFHHPGHPHLYQHQHPHPHSHHEQGGSGPALTSPLPAGIPTTNGAGLLPDPRAHAQVMGVGPSPGAALPTGQKHRRPKKGAEQGHAGTSPVELTLAPPVSTMTGIPPATLASAPSSSFYTANRPPMTAPLSSVPLVDSSLHMHNANVPTRKQNQSCDNCRRRKIACRPPAPHLPNPHRRCAHCLNKGVDCTHDYVSRVQGAKLAAEASKKPRKTEPGKGSTSNNPSSQVRARSSSSYSAHTFAAAAVHSSDDDDKSAAAEEDQRMGGLDDDEVQAGQERARNSRDFRDGVTPSTSAGSDGESLRRKRPRVDSDTSYQQAKVPRPLSSGPGRFDAGGVRSSQLGSGLSGPTGPRLHPTAQLIRYLLSPSDAAAIQPASLPFPTPLSASASALSSYFPTPLRLPVPTPAAQRLATDAKLRSEVLHDFVESFLMIVNPRFALLDARRVRAGIYPFEELVLDGSEQCEDGKKKKGRQEGDRAGRRRGGRRWRHAEEYLYRSDTDGEQDDGGLPSCAPASRQQRDQHIAPAPTRSLRRASLAAAATNKDIGSGGPAKFNGTSGVAPSATSDAVPREVARGQHGNAMAGSTSGHGTTSKDLHSLRPRPLPDVLIAVVLAFGAKFSSHEILGADRADSARYLRKAWDICKGDAERRQERKQKKRMGGDGVGMDQSVDSEEEDGEDDEDEDDGAPEQYTFEPSILCSGRSTIGKSLLIKAQDVLEKRRAFALPTLTNVQAALLMEPLFDQGVRLDEQKRGTPKWEVLAELLQQMDGEEGAATAVGWDIDHYYAQNHGDMDEDTYRGAGLPIGSRHSRTESIVSGRELDGRTTRRLLRMATQLSARTRGSDNTGAQPSLDFCGFWHSVALRHLLELRLHEADYVATLSDIDILTARRPDFFGETELERKLLEEELKASVEAERHRMDAVAGQGVQGCDEQDDDEEMGGDAGVVPRRGNGPRHRRMAAHRLNALDGAIGATNSLGTLAQSAWWMASTSDAITSAFFRKRPLMRPEEMLGGHVPSEDESEGEAEAEADAEAAEGDADADADADGNDADEGDRSASKEAARDSSGGLTPGARSLALSKTGAGVNNGRPGSPQTHSSARQSNGSSVPPGGSAASANRRRMRKLQTGGITREAGPDPFEGSDESDAGQDGGATESAVAVVDKSAAAMNSLSSSGVVPETASAGTESGSAVALVGAAADLSMPDAGSASGTDTGAKRARAKREKLALLGERASLPEKDSYQIWYSGISELCKIHRLMWDTLWSPRARAQGVQLRPLQDIQRRTEKWRKTYLPKMGVPYDAGGGTDDSSAAQSASWPKEWDFIAASTANTLSINSFALDILMWQAVEDHGIAEAKEEEQDDDHGTTPSMSASGPNSASTAGSAAAAAGAKALVAGPSSSSSGLSASEPNANLALAAAASAGLPGTRSAEKLSAVARAERSVCNNALAASLRIAALVEVLRANYYLRLDPNILHFTIHAAGQFLVTYDNPAVHSIIDGLKQYGLSYEEGLEQADQLEAYALAAQIPHPSSLGADDGGGHGDHAAGKDDWSGHNQRQHQHQLHHLSLEAAAAASSLSVSTPMIRMDSSTISGGVTPVMLSNPDSNVHGGSGGGSGGGNAEPTANGLAVQAC
ncbi:hypothetical protein OC834_006838 [Tilletia horrida]|nr:hypothetical protein OC834_006838 [Tilletia horrida]